MSLSQTPNSHVSARGVIPDATVSRLPMYHRSLLSLTARGVLLVSSEELAEASGVSSAKLRKDLSFLGSYGTRGVGYDVEFLLYQIARALGLTQVWPVVIVGIGNLGNALAGYPGFASRGFSVVGLFDTDPNRVGETVTVAGRSCQRGLGRSAGRCLCDGAGRDAALLWRGAGPLQGDPARLQGWYLQGLC